MLKSCSIYGLLAILLILAGCSSHGEEISAPAIPAASPLKAADMSGNRYLWGLYDISINPADGSVDIACLRAADFTLNVTQFMQPPVSPGQMLSYTILPGTNFSTGYVKADVTVKHPFPGTNLYNGFDVRGILIADGTKQGVHDTSVRYATEDETRLLNADGYTRWWNPTEFLSYDTIFGFTSGNLAPPVLPSATVNGYKYFADGLDATSPMSELDTSNRGFFAALPGINTRRYEIQFKKIPSVNYQFQYAIDASWAKPDASYAPTYPPEAFGMGANCREAFMVDVTDAGSTAWYMGPGDYGGEVVLQIVVSDWQGLTNPGGSLAEFSEVWLEGDILGGAKEVLASAELVSYEPLTFTFKTTLEDLVLTKTGTEYLFGTVVSSSPTTYKPQLPGGDAFSYPAAALSAFFKCEVEIVENNEPPIWYTYQGNRAHTGCIGLNGPSEVHNAPTWTHFWQPNPYGNPLPVFLTADAAYLSNTGDGGPLPCGAVDIVNKTTKWNQQFHDDMQNWLNLKGLSEDGTVAICSESGYNKIYGLDTDDGSMLWSIDGVFKADTYPTVDLAGNFIIPNDKTGIERYQSVNPYTGAINWTSTVDTGYYDVPAVGDNGRIYATSGTQNDGNIAAIDPSDGSLIWKTGSIGQARMNGVTVHPNGTIIIHGTDGLFCFEDNGDDYTQLWVQPYNCPFFTSVGVGPEGHIYILDYDGILRKLNPLTGATIQSTSGWGAANSFRPAIGADGLIYARTYMYDENEAYMTCWNADCTLRWQYYAGQWFMGDGHMASPAIGQDGALYSSYRTLGLCRWKDSS